MVNKHRPFDLREEMDKRRRERREREAYIHGLLREPARLAREDPAIGIRALFTLTEGGRRLYRRYLRTRFGYRVWGSDYPLIRYGTLRPERIVKPERLPSDVGEAICFTDALTEWVVWDMVWISIRKVVNGSSCLDEETFQEMYRVCLLSLVRMFDTSRIRLALGKSYADGRIDEVVRGEQSITWLSSWVGARISLDRNSRLKYSLQKESSSPFSRLLQELPATTLIETDNLVREGERPTELVNRVTKTLANVGSGTPESGRDKRLANSDLANVNVAEPMQEAFLAKEKLEALRVSAKLSAREDQVLELMLEDHLDREIASRLGVDEGSVKTTKFRMRQKLKQAAGR